MIWSKISYRGFKHKRILLHTQLVRVSSYTHICKCANSGALISAFNRDISLKVITKTKRQKPCLHVQLLTHCWKIFMEIYSPMLFVVSLYGNSVADARFCFCICVLCSFCRHEWVWRRNLIAFILSHSNATFENCTTRINLYAHTHIYIYSKYTICPSICRFPCFWTLEQLFIASHVAREGILHGKCAVANQSGWRQASFCRNLWCSYVILIWFDLLSIW